ncbi:RNase H domain-containing protein [Trichonephila clavipes]|nr:RNase H domain-containing protein [Trichonephila clavipes]
MAVVAEWYRHRIVAGFVTSSSPVPLKTRRVAQRCTLNLSRAEMSSRWCGVVVRRGGASSGVVHLAVITDAIVENESVDTAVQEVTNVFITAAELSIPKVSSHFFQRYKPWWNADCQTAYKNQRKLWGIFRRYPTTENLLAFKKAKANARRVRHRNRRQSWIRYVSSLTSSTSSKQLWKKVKAANGIYRKFSFPILQTSNSVFSSPEEIANILGETFQSVSSAASYNSRFLEIKRRAENVPR